jgi:hypothetical protein
LAILFTPLYVYTLRRGKRYRGGFISQIYLTFFQFSLTEGEIRTIIEEELLPFVTTVRVKSQINHIKEDPEDDTFPSLARPYPERSGEHEEAVSKPQKRIEFEIRANTKFRPSPYKGFRDGGRGSV